MSAHFGGANTLQKPAAFLPYFLLEPEVSIEFYILNDVESFNLWGQIWVLKRSPWYRLVLRENTAELRANLPLNVVWSSHNKEWLKNVSNEILNSALKDTLTKRRRWQENYLVP